MGSSTTTDPPHGRGAVSGTISAVLFSIALSLYILRAWSACRLGDRWRWDFIWVSLAMIFATASFAFGQASIHYGMGRHIYTLKYSELSQALHWFEPFLVTTIVSSNFAKFSVIALYMQVQGPMASVRPRILWITGFSFSIVNFILIFLIIFGCNPIDKTWNPIKPGTCEVQRIAGLFSIGQSGVSAVTDFILGLLPITLISSLQISRKAKISFCVLMGLSAIPGIASICRAVIVQRAISGLDVTYTYINLMVWCDVELWAIIILGSIPPLRPLFMKMFNRMSRTEDGDRSGSAVSQIDLEAKQRSEVDELRLEDKDVESEKDAGSMYQRDIWTASNSCICERVV
ncbi:hypothetical protein K461DRAFT_289919 [Myriangium duriaei CBS 260.36]|uniref:Rhodopsin domain-containing protein n=1 Tax=Myriangium duriaei CBS 260.36 TaxID=1168546 RepID=A0A9P4MLT2_9PEZI|nr:hypothetical protein K461DRAFT_289919 [Myriangium duriaei CBS 260.36]